MNRSIVKTSTKLGFFVAQTPLQLGTFDWFTAGLQPCGIVYGKILLENLVQSLISLTLRLDKLTINFS